MKSRLGCDDPGKLGLIHFRQQSHIEGTETLLMAHMLGVVRLLVNGS